MSGSGYRNGDGVLWFVWASWSFLGCDRGAGRWRARRRYARGLLPTLLRYLRMRREDRTTCGTTCGGSGSGEISA